MPLHNLAYLCTAAQEMTPSWPCTALSKKAVARSMGTVRDVWGSIETLLSMLTILIVDGECCAMCCNEICLVLRLQGPAWHSSGSRQCQLCAVAGTHHIVTEHSPEAYTHRGVASLLLVVQHVISGMVGKTG